MSLQMEQFTADLLLSSAQCLEHKGTQTLRELMNKWGKRKDRLVSNNCQVPDTA